MIGKPGQKLVEIAAPRWLVYWRVTFVGSRIAEMARQEQAERRACLEKHEESERRWREEH